MAFQFRSFHAHAADALSGAAIAAAYKLGVPTALSGTPDVAFAALSARAFRAVQGFVQDVARRSGPGPRRAEDMLGLARSVECHSPNLAAELRCFAMRCPDVAAEGQHG